MKLVLGICVTGVLLAYSQIDNFDPDELKGKRVFITGASTGIGEQIAYHFAKLGANVVVTARREYRLKEVIKRCKQLSGKYAIHDYIAADMGDLASLEAVSKALEKLNGTIDFLVLNHATDNRIGKWLGSAENFTSLDRNMDINFKSYVHLASSMLPHLRKTDGSIVCLSSFAGKLAQPYLLPFDSSKFAVEGFFAGLRQELIVTQSNISVTVCVIGFVGTESALSKAEELGLRNSIEKTGIADPRDAAMAIIKGAALRQREVYFPYLETRLVTVLRGVLPNWLEAITRLAYSYNA